MNGPFRAIGAGRFCFYLGLDLGYGLGVCGRNHGFVGFDCGSQTGQELREATEVYLARVLLHVLREDVFVVMKCFVENIVVLWMETLPPDFQFAGQVPKASSIFVDF